MVKKGEFTYAAGEDADKAARRAQRLKSKNKQDLETANKMIKVPFAYDNHPNLKSEVKRVAIVCTVSVKYVLPHSK